MKRVTILTAFVLALLSVSAYAWTISHGPIASNTDGSVLVTSGPPPIGGTNVASGPPPIGGTNVASGPPPIGGTNLS